MNKNIIPFRKYDRFKLTRGLVSPSGEVIEEDQVGFAFLKPGSKMFRIKLWVHPLNSYFLVQDDKSPLDEYQVLSIEEYKTQNGETKTNWNKVGRGCLIGNFIKFNIQFFAEDIFLCLFPEKSNHEEESVAI